MHQDSFRSVVCRSLSKSLPSKTKESSCPETAQCAVPCVVALQPTVCRNCRGRDWSPSQSNREDRSMMLQRDYLMSSSLSRRFAEDLLRGAMDLQDSLAMLEKFQTASRSMRVSNKKRRPESCEKSPDISAFREAMLEVSNAKKTVARSVNNGLDAQSRSSTDELKKVVKDSFYRKNTMSVYSNDEQASMSQSSHYAPSKSSLTKSNEQKKGAPRSLPSYASGQPEKSRSPSLVAKLMGLDGLPTHSSNTLKKDEMMKTVSSPRALFDIEMPKVQQNDTHMNSPYSRKSIVSLYDPTVVNELGSIKTVQRDKRIGQSQTLASKDIKVVSHTSRKQQVKETTEMSRRSSDKQKHHSTYRKGEGRKDAKSKTGSTSRSNANVVKRPDKNSMIASSSSSSTYRTRSPVARKSPSNSREKAVSSRSCKNSTIDDIVAYELHRKFRQFDGPSTEHSATPSDESCPSVGWDTEPCMDSTQEDLSESYEFSLTASPAGRTDSASGDSFHPSTYSASANEAEIKDEDSLILLSDQSFLTQAAELIGIGASGHLINRYKNIPKAQAENHKLHLDTATEQLERKHRQQNSLCYTGIWGQKCRTATYFSLEALLREICDATQKLNRYTDDDVGCGTKDTLYMKLEKDLKCTDVSINSVWDMGWEDWICMEETQCFIGDVGESILSGLIEEAALDMWVY
uniref:DUF3741 domain-containing protein n=1 Tax=Leersia perrieri TaxID=77586 RepID=A0A0D9UYT1_9ORYZ